MLEYDRIFWKLLLKGLYLQFLIAISSSLTYCSSVLAYSYSGVLYCTEYQRLCKLTLGICTASNSIKLKCLIGSDCLLFCLSPINSSLIISALHIGLCSLGEHKGGFITAFFVWVVYQISGYVSDSLPVNRLDAPPGINTAEPKIHLCYLCALFGL